MRFSWQSNMGVSQSLYPEFSKHNEHEEMTNTPSGKNWLWVSLLLAKTISVGRNEANVKCICQLPDISEFQKECTWVGKEKALC